MSTVDARDVRRPNVWLPRPRVYAVLQGLGLPPGAAPMAAFLGVEAPADGGFEVTSVEDDALTLQTQKSPHDIATALRGQ